MGDDNDSEARLKLAEYRLSQHEKLHQDTQEVIRTLSEGVAALVAAEARREQDERTFERLFAKIGELEKSLQAHKDAIAAKELAAYKGVVLKVGGLVLLVIASVMAGRFGAHLLG